MIGSQQWLCSKSSEEVQKRCVLSLFFLHSVHIGLNNLLSTNPSCTRVPLIIWWDNICEVIMSFNILVFLQLGSIQLIMIISGRNVGIREYSKWQWPNYYFWFEDVCWIEIHSQCSNKGVFWHDSGWTITIYRIVPSDFKIKDDMKVSHDI